MIHMKCQALFFYKNKNKKKYFKMLSAAVVISGLKVNPFILMYNKRDWRKV